RLDRAPHILDVDDVPDRQQIEQHDQESGEHGEPNNVLSSRRRRGTLDHGDRDSSVCPVHVGSHGVRTDDDSWEITESGGATGLGVAASRAPDSESDDPVISDPFARVFLDTAGDGVWNWFGAPELPAEVIEIDPTL